MLWLGWRAYKMVMVALSPKLSAGVRGGWDLHASIPRDLLLTLPINTFRSLTSLQNKVGSQSSMSVRRM